MDEIVFLIILIVLALLAIPVAVVVLFFRTAALRDKVATLERTLAANLHAVRHGPLPTSISEAQAMAQDTALPDDPRMAEVPPQFRDQPEMPEPTAPAPQADAAMAAQVAAVRPSAWDIAVNRSKSDTPASGDSGAEPPPPPVPDRTSAFTDWITANWIYVVSAASLGLAGIFFVQYGMERGLLPPALRVIAAILFGAALIGAGEWIRRRHGDEGPTNTIHLPSVFSGAGLVSIFAATLAARHLYGLISPEVAFAGHLFTAALAVALGWFYGPLLAAVGLIGAALSPFIVAGGSDAAPWLYAYFALITAAGLGIDAVRQWRWLSVLALCLGYGGAFLTFGGQAGEVGFAITLVILALIAVVIPPLSLTPRHPGPCMLQYMLGQSGGMWPLPSSRLAMGTALASTALLFLLAFLPADFPPLLVPLALTALALAYLLWARRAEGLADLAVVPSLAFLAMLALHATSSDVFKAYMGSATKGGVLPTALVNFIPMIVLMAFAISGAAIWRALRRQDRLFDLMFSLIAVLMAPVTIAILELLWVPAPVIGLPLWAGLIVGTAALMTWLATRFAAIDQGDMRRAAYATLSALSLIALALFLMTTATALTLALAVLIVVAAGLDRRFNLPEMGLFQQIGVAVLSYRLLLDPGLEWAIEGPLLQVILAFTGSIAAMVAAWFLILPHRRSLTRAVLESAAAGLTAIFANVLIARLIMPDEPYIYATAWWVSLQAMPWIVLMLAQLYRTEVSDTLKSMRYGLAAISGVMGAGTLALSVGPFNPLFAWSTTDANGLVQGPLILNSLFVAYAMPGLLLLAGWRFMPGLAPTLRLGFLAVASALMGLYTVLEIRHWFQGAFIGGPGVTQGELYTYTLALMLLGAALLIQSIRKGSTLLRRVAMAVIGLTIAKVFLVDASGLTGLTRVFSFLGLGLSLAGLAWLNRWAERAAKAQ